MVTLKNNTKIKVEVMLAMRSGEEYYDFGGFILEPGKSKAIDDMWGYIEIKNPEFSLKD